MSVGTINVFLCGALAVASAIAGLFFMRYWRTTRDRFFTFFAAAFWLMGANWTATAAIHPPHESRHYIYVVRLIAFLLILTAIVDKNRRR